MWQDLYRDKFDSWFGTPPTKPTYSNPLPDTGLSPFHNDGNGTLYKSVDCAKQAKQLDYTYPKLKFCLNRYKIFGLFGEQKYRNMLKADIETKYSMTGKSAFALEANAQLATVHLTNMAPKNIAIESFPPRVAEIFRPRILNLSSRFSRKPGPRTTISSTSSTTGKPALQSRTLFTKI